MEKLTKERMQANLDILDILRDVIKERPELRFGQLLYDVGVLKSHYNELVGKSITDDIFNIESIDILNQLKDSISKKDNECKSDSASTYKFAPNPIKVVNVADGLDEVEIEPHIKMIILSVKEESLDISSLESFITACVSKNVFVAGIAIGDFSNKELPETATWFYVKSQEAAGEIVKGIFQIVGIKGIVDLDVDDVIFSMKGGTPYYAYAVNEKGNLKEAIDEVTDKLGQNTVWWEPDYVLLFISYNQVNGKDGLSMRQMEAVSDFVSYCGEYANYRWGLAAMPDLPKGAIKVIAIAS